MELILAVACEDARARPDGRLDLVGVFDELSAPGFPARQDRMTVVFVMEWSPEQEGRREFRADLVDDEGTKVLTIEGHTDVTAEGRRRPRTRVIMPLEQVIFPHAGAYRFRLTVGSEALTALPLYLSEAPEGS
ncbi:MAG: DUF6941 family protein [Candidatus Longimicrobiales bacterium M2_2A_002]